MIHDYERYQAKVTINRLCKDIGILACVLKADVDDNDDPLLALISSEVNVALWAMLGAKDLIDVEQKREVKNGIRECADKAAE